jgi:SAM-dependent MidA family methyltransferase
VTLCERITQEIRDRGPIPFSRYMELCLYDPEFGFYSRNVEQFGKAGDFYTSSDVHAVFGRLLARQFEEMWRALGEPAQLEILELGPGRGLFACDVLDWSEKRYPDFFSAVHYSLVESSCSLRKRVQVRLSHHLTAGRASILQSLDENTGREMENGIRKSERGEGDKGRHEGDTREGPASGVPQQGLLARALGPGVPIIIFANEFFDALPVEVISAQGQLHIAEQDGRLVERWAPACPGALALLDHYGVHPEPGERLEAPFVAQKYMAQAASLIRRGFLIAIDYGYTRGEQLAGRHRGTLMTYRMHSAGPNPYHAPGEQDITAHVNFTALAAAAAEQGMEVHPLLTQSQFLLGIGESNQFADAFEDCRLPQERAKVALQLKHLLTPSGVGEAFQVMIASRGISKERVAKLSGINFGKDAVMARK